MTDIYYLSVPTRTSFVRHVIEVGGFHCFFLYTNYVSLFILLLHINFDHLFSIYSLASRQADAFSS